VVHLVRNVLGPAVVGAYPHGSAVLGGLRPHSADHVIDVIERLARSLPEDSDKFSANRPGF
jgi:streptomycin 3"-adenylyltransferase